jgi:hypothetical protein
MLVDKGLNDRRGKDEIPGKSVFSLGDFRHNLLYKEQADAYMSKVSQQPKNFMSWDDGTRFNPKYKRDVIPNSLPNTLQRHSQHLNHQHQVQQ